MAVHFIDTLTESESIKLDWKWIRAKDARTMGVQFLSHLLLIKLIQSLPQIPHNSEYQA
jgi:hypothetical protein